MIWGHEDSGRLTRTGGNSWPWQRSMLDVAMCSAFNSWCGWFICSTSWWYRSRTWHVLAASICRYCIDHHFAASFWQHIFFHGHFRINACQCLLCFCRATRLTSTMGLCLRKMWKKRESWRTPWDKSCLARFSHRRMSQGPSRKTTNDWSSGPQFDAFSAQVLAWEHEEEVPSGWSSDQF